MGINNYLLIKYAAGTDKSQKKKETSIADHNSVGVPTVGYALNRNPEQVFRDALDYTGLSNDPNILRGLQGSIGVLEPEGIVRAIENGNNKITRQTLNENGERVEEEIPVVPKRQEVLNRPIVNLPVDAATGRLNTNTIRSKDRALAYGLTGAGIGGGIGLGGSLWAANKLGITGRKRLLLSLLSTLGLGAGGAYIGSSIGSRPIELQQATPGHARTWYHPWTTPAREADPRIQAIENVEGRAVGIDDLLTDNAQNEYNKEVNKWTN